MVAQKPHIPKNHATIIPNKDIIKAIHKPHRPGIFPEGIGRCGSFMASTSLSYQSLTAWLIPQTNGPDRNRPAIVIPKVANERFELDTAPHRNAHMGGNHVIGFIKVNIDPGEGKRFEANLSDDIIKDPFFHLSS